MSTCRQCGATGFERRFCGRCGAALEPADGPDEERVSLSGMGVRPALPRPVLLVGLTLALAAALGVGWLAWVDDDGPGARPSAPAADAGPASRVRIGIPRPLVDAGAPDAGAPPRDAVPDAGLRSAGLRSAGLRSAGRGAGRRGAATPGPPTPDAVEPSGTGATPRPPTELVPSPQPTTAPTTTGVAEAHIEGANLADAQVAEAYMADARRHIAHGYRAEIQGCFDAGRARRPGLRGTVVVSMVPHADGRVASARVVSDDTGEPSIGECLTQAARGWQLPAPPRRTLEVQMRYRL